jgi:filamentous hemagglutinin family protein
MKAFRVPTRTVCILATMIMPAVMRANPKGGEVKAGAASFESGSNTLTIRQSSDRGIIHWDEFSIQQGEITKFLQPNSNSATLNRVVGTSASSLLGTLQSNGKIYLINPNGILIGPSARIDTGSFVASTLDLADSEFMAGGDMKFFGSSMAAVTNLGTIHASSGDVFLLGREVNNAGSISAPNGVVGLGAGSEILLKAAGDERLFVRPGGAGKITNSGTIAAAQAELKANGGNPYGLAINNTGTVRATGVVNKNGRILLTATGGTVKNTGTLAAKHATGAGAM